MCRAGPYAAATGRADARASTLERVMGGLPNRSSLTEVGERKMVDQTGASPSPKPKLDRWCSSLRLREPRRGLKRYAGVRAGVRILAAANVLDVHSPGRISRIEESAASVKCAVTHEEPNPVAESAMQRDVRTDDEGRRLRAALRFCRPRCRRKDDYPVRLS